MSRIDPESRLTRAERLAAVVAILGAVALHLIVLLGWARLARWAREEPKRERLMVVRRVPSVMPRDVVPQPAPPRRAAEGVAGGPGDTPAPPRPPEPKVTEEGPEPPEETAPPPAEETEQVPPESARSTEHDENSVSVVTDLPGAAFVVEGAASRYRGSGTFWVRRGAPPGSYTVTFNPVGGYLPPPPQTKELVAKGQIVFVGKYRRSTEVVVDSNEPAASFTIYRPDGRPIDMSRLGRTLLDDLPPGTYTAVFKDLPGHIAPAPVSRTLSAGGKLSFFGEYREARAAVGGGGPPGDGGSGARGSGAGAGGSGSGRGGRPPAKTEAAAEDPGLDRRVQMVVKSYPQTDIESDFDPIPYPEVIIRKSNFQQGWCQVYLVLKVDDRGDVQDVAVERPRPNDRAQFESLIQAVEQAVRGWDYDRVASEVHVDVRFYVE